MQDKLFYIACQASVKITDMKAIQMFFEILSKYQQLKTELKCKYETHKMNCRITYDKHYKKLYIREQ